MTFQIITAILTILSILGAYLNAKKKIEGFYIWIISNIGWIIIDTIAGLYFQSILFVVYTIICIEGIIQWRKSDGETNFRKGQTKH